MIKLAFVDVDTGEYYYEDSFGVLKFTSDIDKAKVYLANKQVEEYFEYVEHNSQRKLKIVEIELSRRLVGDSNFLANVWAEKEKRYFKLAEQAEKDIDEMSDAEYKLYKKLKRELNV